MGFLNKFLIVVFLLSSNILIAQYNSSDFLNAGDSLRISTSNILFQQYAFDSTGVDILWDFSGLEAETQTVLYFNDPQSFGYQLPWCLLNGIIFNCGASFDELTNIGVRQLDTLQIGGIGIQNSVSHYKKDTEAYVNTMNAFQLNLGFPIPIIQELTEKDTLFRFPVVFGDSYQTVNYSSSDFTQLGVPFKQSRRQIKQHNVDAMGTIVTPFGSFSDAIKMRTDIITYDTITIDSIIIPTERQSVEYRWFTTQLPYPVLETSGLVVAGIPLITNIQYIDSLRCVAPSALFGYLPLLPEIDSSTGIAEVNTINLSSNADEFEWIWGDGGFSTDVTPTISFACSGFNNITLIAKSSCDDNLIDTLTIPVFISDSLNLTQINTNLTLSNDSIYAAEIGYDEIEWIDCNSEEILSTNTNIFVIPGNGLYKARITKLNCIKETECINYMTTSLSTLTNLKNPFTIYPNPTDNYFYVEPKENIFSLTLLNNQGTIIRTYPKQTYYTIPQSLSNGLYYIKITDDFGQSHMLKLVITNY